ncbi:hypothetical protein A7D21_29385 [Pseudomonas sp. AP19]|nr:hypothetical protein A7D21_29385 [Pseudomonas sp. AP19]
MPKLRNCTRCAIHAFLVIVLWAAACLAAAEPTNLAPEDLQLKKSVRSGDSYAVQAALAAGGHIRRNEFEFPLMPIAVAVILDKRNVLPLLVTDQDSADEAYFFSILSANVAAFESLLTIRAPSPKVISSGLRLFAVRLSVATTETMKTRINQALGDSGQPPADPPWWLALFPTPLVSADAPELSIAKKLRELGSDVLNTGSRFFDVVDGGIACVQTDVAEGAERLLVIVDPDKLVDADHMLIRTVHRNEFRTDEELIDALVEETEDRLRFIPLPD